VPLVFRSDDVVVASNAVNVVWCISDKIEQLEVSVLIADYSTSSDTNSKSILVNNVAINSQQTGHNFDRGF